MNEAATSTDTPDNPGTQPTCIGDRQYLVCVSRWCGCFEVGTHDYDCVIAAVSERDAIEVAICAEQRAFPDYYVRAMVKGVGA